MKRTVLNFLIDALATAVMLAMIATGIIIRFTLPPGSGQVTAVWGLSRHQWGDLHFWLALAVVAIVVLHLALHWTWVVSVARRFFAGAPHDVPSPRMRTLAAAATVLLVCSALTGFWWTSVHSVQHADGRPFVATELPAQDTGIRGSMTLAQTAAALNLSLAQVKTRLGLPPGMQDSQRLGQIAREQGTTMQELRHRLAALSPEPKP